MSCTACIVIRSESGWMVSDGSLPRGPYLSSDMALKFAYFEAANLRRNGKPARISVRQDNGDVIAEYCLCMAAKFAA